MRFLSFILLAAAAFASATQTATAAEPSYPDRTITFVVPYPPGGSADSRARLLAQKLADKFSVTVVVDNRSGASGNIGTMAIARAKPDGYTIGLGNFAPMAVNKTLLADSMQFDPLVDLKPVVLLEKTSMVLGINPSLPYRSAMDLISDGKANPGKLNYASTGAGSASHLVGELFQDAAGFTAVHVPYKGGAPAIADLMGGQVEMFFFDPSTGLPLLTTGKSRPLAVTSEDRLAALPNVPTFKELGMPRMVFSNWFGLIVPAGTPGPIIGKLNATLNAILKEPEYRQLLASQGSEPGGGTPEDFASFIRAQSQQWGQLIQDKKISVK